MAARRIQFVVACLLLCAVVIIVIAPSVDLEPSAMRAQQAAAVAMAALIAAGGLLFALVRPRTQFACAFIGGWALPTRPPDLVDLICSRLC